MRMEWSAEDLVAPWTLVGEDWSLVGNKTGATRLGFAVFLKFFEIEARFPRYGGPGVMICWHIERRSSYIYSQLKHCSSSEVAAMIEGLLRHCTDAEIDTNYLDTHGASMVGFAFTELLEFRLLPG